MHTLYQFSEYLLEKYGARLAIIMRQGDYGFSQKLQAALSSTVGDFSSKMCL